LFKILLNFCLYEMEWSRACQKCAFINFLKQFYCKTGFCKKNLICKFFLQILKKVKHKSFPMMYHLLYLDIKHVILGGGSNWPLPHSTTWFSSTPAGIGLKRIWWLNRFYILPSAIRLDVKSKIYVFMMFNIFSV